MQADSWLMSTKLDRYVAYFKSFMGIYKWGPKDARRHLLNGQPVTRQEFSAQLTRSRPWLAGWLAGWLACLLAGLAACLEQPDWRSAHTLAGLLEVAWQLAAALGTLAQH